MNRRILWTVVIIIILITGFLTYRKLYAPTPALAPTENQSTASTTSLADTSNNPTTIFFKCDSDKSFGVQFVLPNQAHITLDSSEELLLTQSTSSPHLFESATASFYVEGDASSLQLSGEKYDNCAVANQ